MNEIIQAMIDRRSIRSFKPELPEQEKLDQVIEAGLYAASGMGKQSPIILAITDRETRDRLSEANRRIGGWDEGFDPFYGAPAILVVLGDKSVPTHVYDGSLVMGNLMLASHALGLGSIWIHRAKEEFEEPEWKELLAKLGVEGDFEGIGHCAIGVPAGELPKAPARKDGRVFRI